MIYMSLIIGVFAVVFRVILWWTVVIFGLRVLILMILRTPKRPLLLVNISLLLGSLYFWYTGVQEFSQFKVDIAFYLFVSHCYFMYIEYLDMMDFYIKRNPSL